MAVPSDSSLYRSVICGILDYYPKSSLLSCCIIIQLYPLPCDFAVSFPREGDMYFLAPLMLTLAMLTFMHNNEFWSNRYFMLSTKQCALYILLNITVDTQCSCYCKHHLLFLSKEIKAQAIKKLALWKCILPFMFLTLPWVCVWGKGGVFKNWCFQNALLILERYNEIWLKYFVQ